MRGRCASETTEEKEERLRKEEPGRQLPLLEQPLLPSRSSDVCVTSNPCMAANMARNDSKANNIGL